jgi:hypothetical protein
MVLDPVLDGPDVVWLGAQRRHFLALEQAGDKPESLVHDVTLLPRHAPSWWGQSLTHPLGIRCYLSLRKDNNQAISLQADAQLHDAFFLSSGNRW